MRVTSKQGQWLGDIAIREAGSIEAVVEVAVVNDVSITGNMVPGTSQQKPNAANKRVMSYYNINDIHPATSTELDKKSLKGIGYMAIGSNFKVSENE